MKKIISKSYLNLKCINKKLKNLKLKLKHLSKKMKKLRKILQELKLNYQLLKRKKKVILILQFHNIHNPQDQNIKEEKR